MRYNTFTTPQTIVLDGAFPHPTGVVISDSMGVAKTTRARASLHQSDATRWSFDFSEQLLFSLCHAYGTGAEDIFNGGYELIAWRDFVEDVEKAYPDKDNVWEESQMGRGDLWIPDGGSTVVGKL